MAIKVVLLSGIPGSGKSTYVSKLKERYSKVFVVSADHYFTVNGEYKFDVSKLGEAHGDCLKRFAKMLLTLEKEEVVVVVDNTNTTQLELAPYVAFAAACGAETELRFFKCSPNVAVERNIHGVPFAACQAMAKRMETLMGNPLPYHWNLQTFVQ